MEKITDKILTMFELEWGSSFYREHDEYGDTKGDPIWLADFDEVKDFISKIPPLIIKEIKRRMKVAPQVRDDYLNGYSKALEDFTKILNEI